MHSQKALPNLKRKQKVLPLHERVSLEKVLGFTVNNSCALATDPNTGLIAYPAGCVVVLYNPRRNKQTHLVNSSKKAITCLAFSKDGRYLATGECGHQPAVRLWDLQEMVQTAEFQGHKFGINAVIFSPNQKNLISVGSQYDMMVNVWNWRTHCKVASNKVAAKVTGIAFSEDSSTFVTVGNRHVKFWNMDSSKSRIKETVPLKGHSGILREQKNNFFCGVCCGHGSTASKTYAITRSGLLCEFNDNRLLDKWVELRASATCVVAQEHYVFVGCTNGIVRVFNATTLFYVTTLPRPHHLGIDVALGQDPSCVTTAPADALYPDTVAISIDEEACKLTCIYNDHSLYIWDIRDIKKIGKCRSFLYHSAAIWGVEVYPLLEPGAGVLPRGSFITCSGDDTIRIWNVDPHMSTDTAYKHNIYSNELLKVIYTDPDLSNIIEKEFNPAGKNDKTDTQYQDTHGVRSLSVSHDGRHLASGDRVGNIRIHELESMEELHMLEAHDSEVLCLEYSRPALGKKILASTSRDRLIHIFDCDSEYELLQTLDDHSAAITSVKFYETEQHQLGMLSCGMDKSLLFRAAQLDPELQFVMTRHLVGKTTLYDMCLDPRQKFVATACQDRNIRIYNLKNGKHKKSYYGSTGTDGTLLRLAQDRSGAYVVASCSNKNVGIFDFFSGECMASMLGHSEVVTGVRFTNDMKHVISVSGDGCIFIWRLPYDMTEQMCKRLMETNGSLTNSNLAEQLNEEEFGSSTAILDNMLPTPDKNANLPPDPGANHKPDFRFSVGQLPFWAKRQILQDTGNLQKPTDQPAVAPPSGRWAQRAIVKSVLQDGSSEEATNFASNPLCTDNGKYMVETIIADDECDDDDDDDDDEDFKQFRSNKTFDSNKSFGQNLQSEDEEEEDDNLPSEDVVFFPSKDEEDSSETTVRSYRVFEGEVASVAESDGTELSVESDEEEASKMSAGEHSSPTTPDRGQFLLNQFSLEDGTDEKFGRVLPSIPPVNTENSTRLSMSAKFLSLSQQQDLRHVNRPQPSALQQRRQIMAQAVMETRRRLQSDTRDFKGKDTSGDQTAKESPSSTGGGSTTPVRTRWRQVEPPAPSLAASVQRWNSMFDMSNRSQSPGRRSDRDGSAFRKNRSRTPVILAPSRQSDHPRHSPKHSASDAILSLARSHSQHDVPRNDTETSAAVKSTDNLSCSLSSTDLNSAGFDESSKVGGRRCPSYQSATKSSKAKSRYSLDSAKETNITNRRSPCGRVLTARLKDKFKSTPDLLNVESTNDENSLPPSKTAEDLRDSKQAEEKDYQPKYTTQGLDKPQQTKNLILSTGSASCKESTSPTPSSSSGYISGTSNITSKPAATVPSSVHEFKGGPVTGQGKASGGSQDLELMPPPATTVVLASDSGKAGSHTSTRRTTMPELTLQQAKQILLGRPSSFGSGPSAKRRNTMTEGTPSMLGKQRPHSAMSVVLDNTQATSAGMYGSTAEPTVSTQAVSRPLEVAFSTASHQASVNSVTTASATIKTAATSVDSCRVSQKNYMDDLPEKDMDTAAGDSLQLGSRPKTSHAKVSLTTATTVHKTSVNLSDEHAISTMANEGKTKIKLSTKKGSADLDITHQPGGDKTPSQTSDLDKAQQESKPTLPQPASELRYQSQPGGPTRHRDPNAYTHLSPARQVVITNTMTAPAIRPPSIPAPVMPPRELVTRASISLQRPASDGQKSPSRGPSTTNLESPTKQWPRAQQIDDREQPSTPVDSTDRSEESPARVAPPGEQQQQQQVESTKQPPDKEPTSADIKQTDKVSQQNNDQSDDPDQEIKRPDKTRSSPPVSLVTDVSDTTTPRRVILNPPSSPQTTSARRDSSSSIATDFKLAFKRILAAYTKACEEAGSSDQGDARLLRETLQQAQSDLIQTLGPPSPDFMPYLKTKVPSSTNLPTSSTSAQLHHTQSELLLMLDYYSSQMCQLISQKLDQSESSKK